MKVSPPVLFVPRLALSDFRPALPDSHSGFPDFRSVSGSALTASRSALPDSHSGFPDFDSVSPDFDSVSVCAE